MSPGLIFHADVTSTIDRVEAWLAKEAPNSGQGHDHELWASCVLAEEGYTLPETLVALLRAVKSWRRPDPNARTTITSGWKRVRDQGRLGKGGQMSEEFNQTEAQRILASMREEPGEPKEPDRSADGSVPVNIIAYRAAVPDEIPWIVRPLVYQGGVTMLSGPAKAGKSTLAAQIQRLLELDPEEPFLHEPRVYNRPCLLVTEEAGVAVVYKTDGLSQLDVYDWAAGGGEPLEHTLNVIVAWVEAHPEGVVFIDTLSMWAGIEDENDASKVTKAISLIKRLAGGLDVAVVLIHHSRKAAGAHGEAIRGSGAMLATVDISVELKRTSSDGDDRWLDVQGRVIFPERIHLVFDKASKRYAMGDAAGELNAQVEAWLVGVPTDGSGVSRPDLGRLWDLRNPRDRIKALINAGRMRETFESAGGKGPREYRYWAVPPAYGSIPRSAYDEDDD